MSNNLTSLTKELLHLADIDQNMRIKVGNDHDQWDYSVDKHSTKRLKEIIKQIGWPTISKVGVKASDSAWLLVQHSPDLKFMKLCLKLMKSAPKGEVKPANIAYLEDRVLTIEGKPQIYGTQFLWSNNKLEALPIKDAKNVDKLRASVGLGSFAENEARLKGLH